MENDELEIVFTIKQLKLMAGFVINHFNLDILYSSFFCLRDFIFTLHQTPFNAFRYYFVVKNVEKYYIKIPSQYKEGISINLYTFRNPLFISIANTVCDITFKVTRKTRNSNGEYSIPIKCNTLTNIHTVHIDTRHGTQHIH